MRLLHVPFILVLLVLLICVFCISILSDDGEKKMRNNKQRNIVPSSTHVANRGKTNNIPQRRTRDLQDAAAPILIFGFDPLAFILDSIAAIFQATQAFLSFITFGIIPPPDIPTSSPSSAPSFNPTEAPSHSPFDSPTKTISPTRGISPTNPSPSKTIEPTSEATGPSPTETKEPTSEPTSAPSAGFEPSPALTMIPTKVASPSTTMNPTKATRPSPTQTKEPTSKPSSALSAGFDIQLDIPLVPEMDQDAFLSAKTRWEEVVIGGLEDFSTFDLNPFILPNGCSYPSIIDDLYICGSVEPIDDRSNVLGYASPVYGRVEGSGGSFAGTIAGIMVFDEADVPFLKAEGKYESVVLHEMGHVLGIGSLWEEVGITNPEPNCQYVGTKANAEWEALTGCLQIPTELDFGEGTRCGHWDEACLGTELMTGFAEFAGVEIPLSRLTIATLDDLGYEVNYDAADDYSVTELNTTVCPLCSRRGLREHSTITFTREVTDKEGGQKGHDKKRRKLSAEMEAKAVAYGKSILEVSASDGEVPAGLLYVGDKAVSIIVEENGAIYDVLVTAF